ncbi:hypothetical protein D3C71_1126920 [compost metagenome]
MIGIVALPQKHHAHERRPAQVESAPGLLGCQRVQCVSGAGAVAPVHQFQGRLACLVDPLQIALAGQEAATQRGVTRQYRGPCRAQALRIDVADVHAQLIDVSAALGSVQRVEEHPLLDRRKRIQVFEPPRRQRQLGQLRRVQPRLWKVAGRDARGATGAVRDQRAQFGAQRIGQRGHRRRVPVPRAVHKLDLQAAVLNFRLDHERMLSRRRRIPRLA